MAASPAILVLFLCFNLISGYTLLREDEDKIVWPSEYHFKGENLNFESSIKDTFEIWYSAELNRSRIDYHEGSVKIFYYDDTGYSYTAHPITTDQVTNEVICTKREREREREEKLEDFLPDVSKFTYTGKTLTLYDKVVEVWTSTHKYAKKMVREVTLYVSKNDSGVDLLVQKITKEYNYLIGEVSSNIITNYYEFNDTITNEELTLDIEDDCEEQVLGEDLKTDLKFFNPDIAVELDMAFDRYTKHHSKQYRDKEYQRRKAIFEKNWRMVEEHNSKNLSFRIELNEFSDQTDEELKYLTGTRLSTHNDPEMMQFPHTLEEIDNLVKELPENFDLRIEGAVTPVKDQAHCGSCWAFSTTAAVEGAISRVNGGRLLDLSEQSLVDCAWGYDNLGCDGGTLNGAMKYVLAHGIPTELEYGLYTGFDGYCDIVNMTHSYKIRGFAQVTPHNPNALKLALYKYGPVAVAIYASDYMKLYSSGLFYDFFCENSHPNHGVTVIGYGVRDGEDYWIIKNSWGEKWGEDGYILLSARNNNCFLLDSPYYPIA